MGVKTVQILGGLSGVVWLTSIMVFFLPMHRLSFFTGGVFRSMRIDTHLLTVEFNEKDSGFCTMVNTFRPGTCTDGSHSLQDVAQRFCAPQVKFMYPQACDGFQAAFYLGIMLSISLLFNAIGLCTALFALHSYIHGDKHKRSYRKLALISLVISTLQMGASVSLYGLLVYRHLDEMRSRGPNIVNLAFQASSGVGASYGYIACCLIVGLQMFMLAIWKYTKTSEEQSDEEIKEQKLFAAEAQSHMGYGADGAPAPLAAAGPSWGPQGEQVLFAAGGVAVPQMPWDPSGDAGGMQPLAVGVQQVGAYHEAVSSAYEVQPAEIRRGQTYMPNAPPGSAV